MARDLAIDLGTANTLVYARGEGIVLAEPSVIAMNKRTGDVIAMGREAWKMIGRTPAHIVAVRPLRKGAITDFEVTQRMVRMLLERVGVSRFNRPKVLNALDGQTMEELSDALERVRQDPDIKVLILTGAGEKAFVAGADINMLARQTPMSARATSRSGQEILNGLETMGKPSIAAVNGFALGGGCEVAMACTIRYAADTARFGQPLDIAKGAHEAMAGKGWIRSK